MPCCRRPAPFLEPLALEVSALQNRLDLQAARKVVEARLDAAECRHGGAGSGPRTGPVPRAPVAACVSLRPRDGRVGLSAWAPARAIANAEAGHGRLVDARLLTVLFGGKLHAAELTTPRQLLSRFEVRPAAPRTGIARWRPGPASSNWPPRAGAAGATAVSRRGGASALLYRLDYRRSSGAGRLPFWLAPEAMPVASDHQTGAVTPDLVNTGARCDAAGPARSRRRKSQIKFFWPPRSQSHIARHRRNKGEVLSRRGVDPRPRQKTFSPEDACSRTLAARERSINNIYRRTVPGPR